MNKSLFIAAALVLWTGAELLTDRAEDAGVVVDVQLQLAGDLFGDLEVALADGGLRAFLEAAHRDEAVDDERQHCRCRDQQHEAGGDALHRWALT